MRKNVLIHIPHSSLYIPEDYKRTTLLTTSELEAENLFMCDFRVDELLKDEAKTQAIIFPYARLYCDVERFKDETEKMNQYGMGYIYTKTSSGKMMFCPSVRQRREITAIYDQHHHLLDETVTKILENNKTCIIIDLHSYSSKLVNKLFGYTNVPDICIGIDKMYYSEKLTNYFIRYFEQAGYSVQINYPYQGSLVPNRYYGLADTGIISIMIEINKRVYEDDTRFQKLKKVLNKSLQF